MVGAMAWFDIICFIGRTVLNCRFCIVNVIDVAVRWWRKCLEESADLLVAIGVGFIAARVLWCCCLD